MKNSVAHQGEVDKPFKNFFPDGEVPFEKRDGESVWRCGYCGSVHPSDAAQLLNDGAIVNMADMKYGWPHKFYLRHDSLPHGMIKFYTVHLQDATPEEKETIESHLGIAFTFENGGIRWSRYTAQED